MMLLLISPVPPFHRYLTNSLDTSAATRPTVPHLFITGNDYKFNLFCGFKDLVYHKSFVIAFRYWLIEQPITMSDSVNFLNNAVCDNLVYLLVRKCGYVNFGVNKHAEIKVREVKSRKRDCFIK